MSVCKGTTKTGNPCKNRSKLTGYCHLHAKVAQNKDEKQHAKPTKICAECGKEKTFFHYDTCLKNQTADILQRIDNIVLDGGEQLKIVCTAITQTGITWKEFCSHERLGEMGCDTVTISWFKKILRLYGENTDHKITIAKALLVVMSLCEYNSEMPRWTSEEQCSHCSNNAEDCYAARLATGLRVKELWMIIFEPHKDDIERLDINLTHLGYAILHGLYIMGEEYVDDDPSSKICRHMYCLLAMEFIKSTKLAMLMLGADKLIGI